MVSSTFWRLGSSATPQGHQMCVRASFERLLTRAGSSVINTASIAGLQAGFEPLAYSTAKAAVIHITRRAAAEQSPQKIRGNAICTGLIATSILGASLGLSREVADQMAARVAELGPKIQPVPKAAFPKASLSPSSTRPATIPSSGPGPIVWSMVASLSAAAAVETIMRLRRYCRSWASARSDRADARGDGVDAV